jgi:hypothetical protein
MSLVRGAAQLPPLDEVLHSAKKKVTVMAMDAGIASTRWKNSFRETLDRGVKVRFLLVDQDGQKWVRNAFRDAWPQIDGFPVLKDTLKALHEIHSPNLSVAFFDLMPLHSLIFIDDRWMQVSNYLYGTFDWVSLMFTKDEEPLLFDKYRMALSLAEAHVVRELVP